MCSYIQPRDIEVISPEPIPEIESLIAGKSRLPVFAIAGALTGAAAGFMLASTTARLYPISTGGMPIVSLLPVGIVTYETMMMFAVLFSLAGLLFEAGLPRMSPVESELYSRDLSDGGVLVLAPLNVSLKAAEGLHAAAASNSNHNT